MRDCHKLLTGYTQRVLSVGLISSCPSDSSHAALLDSVRHRHDRGAVLPGPEGCHWRAVRFMDVDDVVRLAAPGGIDHRAPHAPRKQEPSASSPHHRTHIVCRQVGHVVA